jgi:two-component system LytT family sensor kinase
LLFTIQNTITKNNTASESHGIGLENTKKRLESLYPDQYTLTHTEDKHHYTVQLEIQL